MKKTPLPPTLMKLNKIRFSTLALSVLVASTVSACQSVAPTHSVQTAQLDNQNAKADLQHALARQFRQSFSYQTQIFVEQTPDFNPKKSLNSADALGYSACDTEHDSAYVALAKQAKQAGLDISADNYIDQRAQLKSNYEACLKEVEKSYGYDYDNSETDGTNNLTDNQTDSQDVSADELSPEEKAWQQAIVLEEKRLTTLQDDKPISTTTTDAKEQALTQRQQALLKAYVIEPTKLSITGDYRPLAGVVSVLPSADYQFSNIKMMVNQPIYIDLKSEAVYIWADNLALANASFLDKKLGLSWYNKWLKLPLNDGSLPKEFVPELLKTSLAVKKQRFENLPKQAFSYVLANDLPHELIKTTQGVPATRIIRQEINKETLDKHSQESLQAFYERMTDKYPILKEPAKTKKVDDEGNEKFAINSLAVWQMVFAKINIALDNSSVLDDKDKLADKVSHDESLNNETSNDEMIGETISNFVVDLHDDNNTATAPMPATQVIYYGLDNSGLVWTYRQKDAMKTADKPVQISSLTTLSPKTLATPFARLPKAHQLPNSANSVDVLAYSNELLTRLMQKQEGDLFLWLMLSSLGVQLSDSQMDDGGVDTNDSEATDTKTSSLNMGEPALLGEPIPCSDDCPTTDGETQ